MTKTTNQSPTQVDPITPLAVPGVAYEHPENAHTDAPKRGDYTGRGQPRVHYRRGRRNLFGEFEPTPR